MSVISPAKLRELKDERVLTVPADPRARPVTAPPAPPGRGRVSRRWAVALGVAWAVVLTTGMAVEPAPSDPDAAGSVFPALIGAVLLASWAVAGAGLLRRRRQGAQASLVGALALLGGAVACPLVAHHAAIGAWWFVQLAGAGLLVAMSGAAIYSSTTGAGIGSDKRG